MKAKEVSQTVPSAYESGVPYRRRPVSCQCKRYLVGARWGFRSDCGLPRNASPEKTRKPRRLARVGQHHVGQACMCCCSYCCCCLSVPGPVGTLVIGLNDFSDFSCTFAGEKTVRRGGS